MDKNMYLAEEPDMANNAAKQKSDGELFVNRVAKCGVVLKFKVRKHGTSSESTILPQDLSYTENEHPRDPLDNFEANCAQNLIPLFEDSGISNSEPRDKIPFLDSTVVTKPEEGIYRTVAVDNGATVFDPLVSSGSVAMDNGAIGITRTNSLGNAKKVETENVVNVSGSPECYQVMVAESGSGCGSEQHICEQCGKSFKTIDSLYGHTGGHRRAEYMQIRMMQEQPLPLETSHITAPRSDLIENRDVKNIWKAAQALVEISVESGWQPKHVFRAIHVSTDQTCSSADTGDTTQMRDIADLLIKLAQTVSEDTVKAPSPPSVRVFMCTTCNKMFDSYQALGGHKSSHNKSKSSQLKETAGSSSGSSEPSTWKYVCSKCDGRFPTGQSLGGHKRKHWFEECMMTPQSDGNMQSSGEILLINDNLQSTGTELMVADDTVHLPAPLAYNAVEQPLQGTRLANETSQPSGIADTVVEVAAELPPPAQILPVERCVLDLNKLPPEADSREP